MVQFCIWIRVLFEKLHPVIGPDTLSSILQIDFKFQCSIFSFEIQIEFRVQMQMPLRLQLKLKFVGCQRLPFGTPESQESQMALRN